MHRCRLLASARHLRVKVLDTGLDLIQDLTAGGHLVFDSVSFQPGGTACLGICSTGAAPAKG